MAAKAGRLSEPPPPAAPGYFLLLQLLGPRAPATRFELKIESKIACYGPSKYGPRLGVVAVLPPADALGASPIGW